MFRMMTLTYTTHLLPGPLWVAPREICLPRQMMRPASVKKQPLLSSGEVSIKRERLIMSQVLRRKKLSRYPNFLWKWWRSQRYNQIRWVQLWGHQEFHQNKIFWMTAANLLSQLNSWNWKRVESWVQGLPFLISHQLSHNQRLKGWFTTLLHPRFLKLKRLHLIPKSWRVVI